MPKKKPKLTEDELTGLMLDRVLALGSQGKLSRADAHKALDAHLKQRTAREKLVKHKPVPEKPK